MKIDSEAIERAEKTLRNIYGMRPEDLPRQMHGMEIDEESFARFQTAMFDKLKWRYKREYRAMPTVLEPAFGTLTLHFFLVGALCGRYQALEDRP